MTTVYYGKDLFLQKDVIIKAFHGTEYTTHAKNEIAVLSQMEGRTNYIPKIYDYFYQKESKTFYLVMQRIYGKTLREIIAGRMKMGDGEKKRLEREFLLWMVQIADILSALHQKNIQHKDLKPENIIIQKETFGSHAYLIDFNLSLMRTASGVGTSFYSPPEMIEYNMKYVKTRRDRVDIYSMGALLYEFFGEFQKENLPEFRKKVRSDEWKDYVRLDEINPSIPKLVCDVAEKAMKFNPSERYANINHMKSDIIKLKEKGIKR